MIKTAVIGYGYWGPNIVRNFNLAEGADVVSVCDSDSKRLETVNKVYPSIRTTTDCNELLTSPDIDAVAIVTPVFTHYELAKKALQNGKHIFIEKPFTSTVAEAEELIALAARKNLTIMVDHTFLFTGAVRKIKEVIQNKLLGNLYFFDSTRVNLGLFQHDINVLWDLLPHDLSIMDYVIDERPMAILATGSAHLNGHEDTAYATVFFSNSMIGHFNVNWLSPVKIRNILISGDQKMLVWNDLDPDEKIKIYDRGVDVTTRESIHELLISYRSGDAWIPKVEQLEALTVEANYFVDCVTKGETPINDGHAGLRVVKLLEAASQSVKQMGKAIAV
ncbi:MAG: Gfo/Idh/MocA family oxidoreductase [Thermodesulfobacteriota bacterium]|nr:Gfo/Idh/MocA family oxidoreductase [Thermodesulfobacteriota bacterium]